MFAGRRELAGKGCRCNFINHCFTAVLKVTGVQESIERLHTAFGKDKDKMETGKSC